MPILSPSDAARVRQAGRGLHPDGRRRDRGALTRQAAGELPVDVAAVADLDDDDLQFIIVDPVR
jgi:hypothetical protein